MRKINSIFLICILCACSKKVEVFVPNFDDFIFVDLNLQANTSVKFTGNDTLYFQMRLPDTSLENYISVLNKPDKDSLISRINKLNLVKQESFYVQNTSDNSQVFILNKHGKTKSVCVIGGSGPIEINRFGNWMNKLQAKQERIKTKEYLNFWDLKNVVPPPFPPSKLKKIRFIKK